ncbi:MAG: MltA domain-containing protein [Pseudomonadota bacterium]
MICESGPNRRAVLGAGLGLAAAMSGCVGRGDLRIERLDFSDLNGWADADLAPALPVFAATSSIARANPHLGVETAHWASIAAEGSPRAVFEDQFAPVLVSEGSDAHFTGYYEPELRGSRTRSDRYSTPLYRRPADLSDAPYLTRSDIAAGALDGKGLEFLWIDDAVEAFFLEIQGSGRVRLDDGSVVRVGFAGKNNHPYRAIGRLLVERGEMTVAEASADGIRRWLRAQPDGGAALMNENPSYVFFTERSDLAPDQGPVGAMGAPVTAGLSIAVDPAYHPLGAPIWVEADAPGFEARLMVAQDVGGAIKGPQRGDLFTGSGDEAGALAGSLRAFGRMVTLVPKAAAEGLALS